MFSRSVHRTSPASVAALLAGIVLIAVSLGSTIVQHDRQAESRKRALQNEARSQSERLDNYYARARSLALITARNPGFRNFYAEPGSRTEKIRSGNAASATRTAPSPISSSCSRGASGRHASSTAVGPKTHAP